jgi:hypothetical protein
MSVESADLSIQVCVIYADLSMRLALCTVLYNDASQAAVGLNCAVNIL